jgi:hypothetical protein
MGLFGFFLIMVEIGMIYVADLFGCASEGQSDMADQKSSTERPRKSVHQPAVY